MTDSNEEFAWRFVAVLNKKIEVGKLMNAIGHMSAGIAGGSGRATDMRFLEYQDKEGGVHPNISHFNYVVLKADNSNQIRIVRQAAKERGVLFTDFTSSMTVGTSEDQQARTAQTPETELEYYGICLFGPTDTIKEFTKKFSLFS